LAWRTPSSFFRSLLLREVRAVWLVERPARLKVARRARIEIGDPLCQ
jgi:hypothetical protein